MRSWPETTSPSGSAKPKAPRATNCGIHGLFRYATGPHRWLHMRTTCPHVMRVVQVANFYGPRSGGLRTAVDRLGAEYCATGHEVFLVVPGRYAERTQMPTGVVRITLPARLIPFTGGYRAVMPG